jgi:hypothetical protein
MTAEPYSKPRSFITHPFTPRPHNLLISKHYPYFKATCYNRRLKLAGGDTGACARAHTHSTYTHTHTYKHTKFSRIRGVRRIEKDNWTIHFTWVKAHNDNFGNELADQLAKKAANSEGETAYSKIPKSVVIKEIQDEGELEWQKEWTASTKGKITKTFFPDIGDRKSKKKKKTYKWI